MRKAFGSLLSVVLLVAAASPGSAAAPVEHERLVCLVVRPAEPVEGSLLEALIAGEASIELREPDACTGGAVVGDAGELLAGLSVEAEQDEGYERALFEHWIDADGDGCDTRREVLIEESLAPVTVGAGCSLSGGSWHSAYDGVTASTPAVIHIDHVVPLKEAWRSGAHAWDGPRRRAFANDLDDERSLRAVTSSSNTSKGDRDPARWLPPETGFRCTYVSEWVAVKVRWQLSVDTAELAAIEAVLDGCPTRTLGVRSGTP